MSSTEPTSNRPDEFKTYWLGYISAAIFLYIEGHNINNQGLIIISIFVGIASIFVLLGQLPVKILKSIANYIDYNSRLFFYLIAIVGFIKGTVELFHTTETAIWIWVLLIALFGFILSDIVSIVKNVRKRAILFGWKPTIIKQLKLFSFVIISFVFAMLLKDNQDLGPAYFWLAPGLLSLAVALILEYRIEQSKSETK